MIYSNDVAQLFAAQNQMFSGQNAFANQIGIAPPGTGIGALNTPPSSGGSYNYGPGGLTGPGYGAGNRFAGGVMSGVGAAATFGGMALGAASMSSRFAGLMPFVDPLSTAMAGFRAGGVLGAVGGFALPLSLATLVGSHVNAFVGGGMQQAGINAGLNNFQFFNPASRTGMGFTRQDASGIGQSIRQLAAIPEMLTSVEELTSLLPRLKQSGVMSGVKDALEFSRRFKETVHTIKDVAQILGTTMDEAEKVFSSSRSLGFLGRRDQLQNAVNAQVTSGLTGMSVGQVVGLQGIGAQASFAAGGHLASGARSISNLAQSFGSALRAGTINEGMLLNATGATGEQGIAAASSMAQTAFHNMAHTPAGMALLLGISNKQGNGLNADTIRAINANAISLDQLKSMGRGVNKMAFMRNRDPLAAEAAGMVDLGSFAGMFGNDDDKAAVLLNRYTGMSGPQANLILGMRNSAGVRAEQEQMMAIRARELSIRQQTDPGAFFRRIGTRLSYAMTGGSREGGAGAYNDIGGTFDNFIDDFSGRHSLSLSGEGSSAVGAAARGDPTELRRIIAAGKRRPADLNFLQTLKSGTEFGAWVNRTTDTGRDPAFEMARNMKFFGGDYNMMFDAMSGKYMTSDAGALRSVRRMMEGIEVLGVPFRNLPDARKADEMRSVFTHVVNDPGAFGESGQKLLALARETKKTMGNNVSLVTAMMSATGFGGGPLGINGNNMKNPAAAMQFLGVVGRGNAMREAVDTLTGKLTAQAVLIITKNPRALNLAMDEHAGDIIETMDPGKAAIELGVSIGDIEAAAVLRREIHSKGADKGLLEALNNYHEARRGDDFEVLKNAFNESAQGMVDTGLSGVALTSIQGMKEGLTNFTEGSPQQIRTSVKDAMGLTGSSRAAFLSHSGGMRNTLQTLFSVGDSLKGTKAGVALIMQRAGISRVEAEQVLARHQLREGQTLTEAAIRDIQGAAADNHVVDLIANKGRQANALTKDEQLMQVLKNLQDAINKNSTVLATFSPDKDTSRNAKDKRLVGENGATVDPEAGGIP